jgi:transcriptional regulator GlxA family with amidase domain
MARRRRILFLTYPGMQALDLTGPHQMFAGATAESAGAYELTIAAAEIGPVSCDSGLAVMATATFASLDARALRAFDTLFVIGGNDRAVRAELPRGSITDIVRRAHGRVRRIASVCAGAFFLADAGLLDGKRAATHWSALSELKRFRPAIEVDGESIYVREGEIWTSAGVTAGMDLALAMIEEDLGRDIALRVARRHVVFRIRPGGQSQFSAELEAHAAPDGELRRLTQAIIAAPENDWRIDRMATHAKTSPRTLSRAFHKSLNQSPAAFVERVRVDAARRMLIETATPIGRIAHACGFGATRRLDRAFQRALSISPSAFRARFSSPSKERVK